MAALPIVRISVPRILSLVGASAVAPATLPAGLGSRLARRYPHRWIELRAAVATALISVRDLLLMSWGVTSLTVWLLIALAAGIGVFAPK